MYYILVFIIGLIIGFLFSRFYLIKYIKKNLVTRDFIKTLFKMTGRTPSERQLNELMSRIRIKL